MKYWLQCALVGLLFAVTSCQSGKKPQHLESSKRRVEEALPKLVAKFSSLPFASDAVHEELERYLLSNPQAYGAAFAVDPEVSGKLFSPYVYRRKGQFIRVNLDDPKYDYPRQQWYSEPKRLNQARWSDPYFDDGGGNITMVTYSIPIHAKGKFLGILTTDLPVK